MKKAIVAAGHQQTASAAAEILKSGGNAFDAAIGSIFVACIAEPALSSLGGGGFLTAAPVDGKPVVFDFFVQTPSKHKSEHEIDSRSFICDFGSAQQEFIIGSGTTAVPGCVKGIFETARRYSTVPMRELIQPALSLLKEGVEVTEMQAHIFSILTPIYLNGAARTIYESKRKPQSTLQKGEIMKFPNYDDLLDSLAAEGDDLFYRGEIARAVDQAAQSGGLVTYEDMRRYEVELRTPLSLNLNGYRVFTNSCPSNGGIMIALALDHMKRKRIGQCIPGTAEHFKTALGSLAACSEIGNGHSPQADEFESELVGLYRNNLERHRQATRGTTHISIIDKHNNAVSVSLSNGEGCGTMIPGTSVMLNNMLGEHDVNPHGLCDWPPDTRLSSLMSPTIAVSRDDALIATGSGGSNRIPSAIAQVLLNSIEFGMSARDAVRFARVHYHRSEAFMENVGADSVAQSVMLDYPKHTLFNRRDVFFGGVHTVMRNRNGIDGFGDDRRGGVCLTAP